MGKERKLSAEINKIILTILLITLTLVVVINKSTKGIIERIDSHSVKIQERIDFRGEQIRNEIILNSLIILMDQNKVTLPPKKEKVKKKELLV